MGSRASQGSAVIRHNNLGIQDTAVKADTPDSAVSQGTPGSAGYLVTADSPEQAGFRVIPATAGLLEPPEQRGRVDTADFAG